MLAPNPSGVLAVTEAAAGDDYVRAITARASDRRARAAFQALVLQLAPPGASIFDFGAGPGLDARFYAERGYTVAAYEPDPQMRRTFEEHCKALIESQRITLDGRDYRDFLLRAPAGPGFDLITANFAPLNLVEDLGELFGRLHGLLRPSGQLLASVLNPYFIGDLQYRWWWRNIGSLVREGHFSVMGHQGPIVRRQITNLAAHARPHFRLEQVGRRTCRFMLARFAKAT
jgi:SAM-dependent methyltransferase